ncbi:OmpA family protein [Enterobacter sp. Bisph1]|uniref:OmpA family protein n=1 Tax=Enterobacter sp. Bisph1 TaxID=1274399 RepID=UPI00057BFC7F|nr:OmpA family protein [Enterobacter sp. Bisph1]
MRERYPLLLTILALLLALWLTNGFWSLTAAGRWIANLLLVAVAVGMLWYQWQQQSRRDVLCRLSPDCFPPEDFQGSVVLFAGDTTSWFVPGQPFRETRQGWYLQVENPEQLPELAEQLATLRPALRPQVAVMLGLLPEHHSSDEAFEHWLRNWQRAVTQCSRWLNGLPPVLITLMVSGPSQTEISAEEAFVRWFSITPGEPLVNVCLPGQGVVPIADWLQESPTDARFSRLSEAFWLDALQSWYDQRVGAVLTSRRGDFSILRPLAVGFCLTTVTAGANNLWQQHIAALTALPPLAKTREEILPLPDNLLAGLTRRRGLSRNQQRWRQAGLMTGLFLLLAMIASFINNQRLVRSVGDHLALYHHLDGHPAAPKLQAQQRLRADSQLLDDWLRRGNPLRYGLGLYQGLRLIPPVEAALSDWAPPPPPAPVIKQVVEGPKTVRLDSMSLFDSGKSLLKPGSTKMLVNALVGIKARPGWLIVVSGHTDNTGNAPLNQMLSLKRAEAVRNWMRDTGDLPESCFAVQGYGEHRPIASNDTAEGRALNRRVEISLVPQADACLIPGNTTASSQDDDLTQNQME